MYACQCADLQFTSCVCVCAPTRKDMSLALLAKRLPAFLTSLHLDFSCNRNFTDKSLESLAQGFPANLSSCLSHQYETLDFLC